MKRTLYISSIIGLLVMAHQVSAASLYFNQVEKVVNQNKEFTVDLFIDADRNINTIDINLTVPKGLTFVRSNDASSIISLWIEKPKLTANQEIVFSGIIPGGYAGRGGKLISLIFTGKSLGENKLVVNAAKSSLLLNDGLGTKDTLIPKSITISVRENGGETDKEITDLIAPEDFTPLLVHDPLLNDGKWTVVFETQDKGSGVSFYEVQESTSRKPQAGEWVKVVSPYVLKDQERKSHIFVKAVDAKGNERIKEVETGSYSMQTLMWIGLTALIIISCIIVLRRRRKHEVSY
jgi:LPXTG-motif cell wall-anchored protein